LLYLLIKDLTATSRNNFKQDVKIKVLITIIIALLFPNSRLTLCWIFSYDFTKIRNFPKLFPRRFKNVGPGVQQTQRTTINQYTGLHSLHVVVQ